jgi:hypothetical protein
MQVLPAKQTQVHLPMELHTCSSLGIFLERGLRMQEHKVLYSNLLITKEWRYRFVQVRIGNR